MSITFRKAEEKDAVRIAEIYEKIHDLEEDGKVTTGWQRKIYPTYESGLESIAKGEMYVEEDDGIIVASAKLNQEQVYPAYEEAEWIYEAEEDQVMVIHTLTVDPDRKGKGYGKAFVGFYEEFAKEHGCGVLRIDTNERNVEARRLYRRLGFREASIIPCIFNGIPSVNLVCLEKKL